MNTLSKRNLIVLIIVAALALCAPGSSDRIGAAQESGGFGEGIAWHGSFCYGDEVCAVGDVNGDGMADAIAFARSTKTDDGAGDVWVTLSNGSGFGEASLWHGSFCYGDEVCAVGDVNGDGMADVLAFVRSAKTDDGAGDVWVTLSNGSSFGEASLWHGSFCYGDEVCAVGDVNGDRRADLLAFVRSTKTDDAAGDVWVALSSGNGFGEGVAWHGSFCYGDEVCAVGDVNGDGMADAIAFVRSTKTDDGAGDVWVTLSNGNGFGEGVAWHGSFCYGDEVCAVGDVNGDGMADVLAFVRSAKTDDGAGDVWVTLSNGSGFGEASLWHGSFCYGDEVCAVGDVNGDRRADLLAFVRSTKTDDAAGDVWVALSGASAQLLLGRAVAVDVIQALPEAESRTAIEAIDVGAVADAIEAQPETEGLAEVEILDVGAIVDAVAILSERAVVVRGFAEVTAAGDNLNVRSGPGTGWDAVGQMRTGALLRVLDGPQSADGYTWWQVKTADGSLTGWVVDGAEGQRYLEGRNLSPDEMPGDNFSHP